MTDLSSGRRFNGLAVSGNGGYTCGLLPGRLGRAEGVISASVRDITGGRAGAAAHTYAHCTSLFAERDQ